MSTAVAKSPAKTIRVTKKGEQSAADWIKGVLDGSGSSPAQIIVAVVIGCIPFVGQGVDVGNVIVSIVKIAENPNNKDNWFDLVFNLIAFVPVAGDGLKIVFKQLRSGKAMGAILDAIPSKTMRGNVEKWFRNLNWSAYTKELQTTSNKMIDGLIDVFDSWMTRAVLGQARLKTLVLQLRQMKKVANKQIEMVMQDLQLAHKKALVTPYPNTTAKAPVHTSGSKKPNSTSAPRTQQNGEVLKNTSGNTAKTGSKNTSTKRESKKRSNQELGSGGEHITDYYFVKRKKNRSKINNNGVLYEYNDTGHNGIDHVWHSNSIGHKYRITDSKSTNLASHKKLMTPKAAMAALRMGLDVYMKSDQESKAKRSVGTTVADGVQMSHLWIAKKIDSAKLTVEHRRKLIAQIQAWERVKFKASTEKRVGKTVAVQCPYDRSLVTITGNLFDHHSQCKGLDKPKCTRTVTSHAITLEFVMPNEMLER
ncbi:hypothetical protein BDGL_000626 [Acinetobacter pittii PHEA-2]|uniref:Uncharacterized protein n=1 Tax=Acinetobacter pittii (strain PHEA-2) TaxID=871585 RepID=F0KJN3_ACIP2|nr:hypothetical protein [Acinetobacter pittii]YP_004994894.1 hypothetical protein BDGL_000626 [Acinetobacter pittii PHEA-2]ADY81212.1 hypothetical protein BDGL_000626 [Acinetobacter pittii PHEA-2]